MLNLFRSCKELNDLNRRGYLSPLPKGLFGLRGEGEGVEESKVE